MSSITNEKKERNDYINLSDESGKYNPDNKSVDATLQSFFQILSDFEEVRKNLNRKSNKYMSHIFGFLGYRFKGTVDHPNILHLSAQAWLLGLFTELKKENPKNITFQELLVLLNQIIVEEDLFIDYIRLLSGLYSVEDPLLVDNRIFKIILVNIHATKTELLKETSILKEENLTRENFDNILFEIFKTAFNYTINEFNSREENKKSLDMLVIYDKFVKESDKQMLNVDNFIYLYLVNKNIKEESLTQIEAIKLKIQLEIFFNFCKTSIGILVGEIDLFNKNSNNLISKLKNILSLKNLKRISTKYYELLIYTLEKGIKNMRLEMILVFVKVIYTNVLEIVEEKAQHIQRVFNNQLENVKSRIPNISDRVKFTKAWLNDSVQKIAQTSNIVKYTQEKREQLYSTLLAYTGAMLNYLEVPKMFVQEKIYFPVKNVALVQTERAVGLFLSVKAFPKIALDKISSYIKEKSHKMQDKVKELIPSKQAREELVKIDYDSNPDYMKVSISKKVFIADPQFYSDLMKYIQNFSIVDTTRKIIHYPKNTVNKAKTYLSDTYRNFLNLSNKNKEQNIEKSNHHKSE